MTRCKILPLFRTPISMMLKRVTRQSSIQAIYSLHRNHNPTRERGILPLVLSLAYAFGLGCLKSLQFPFA